MWCSNYTNALNDGETSFVHNVEVFHKEQLNMNDYKPATCQYCLADGNHTVLGKDEAKRCPVCGSHYDGPRRDAEFRVLVEAGLVAEDE